MLGRLNPFEYPHVQFIRKRMAVLFQTINRLRRLKSTSVKKKKSEQLNVYRVRSISMTHLFVDARDCRSSETS